MSCCGARRWAVLRRVLVFLRLAARCLALNGRPLENSSAASITELRRTIPVRPTPRGGTFWGDLRLIWAANIGPHPCGYVQGGEPIPPLPAIARQRSFADATRSSGRPWRCSRCGRIWVGTMHRQSADRAVRKSLSLAAARVNKARGKPLDVFRAPFAIVAGLGPATRWALRFTLCIKDFGSPTAAR
jgi:hypothetical protein